MRYLFLTVPLRMHSVLCAFIFVASIAAGEILTVGPNGPYASPKDTSVPPFVQDPTAPLAPVSYSYSFVAPEPQGPVTDQYPPIIWSLVGPTEGGQTPVLLHDFGGGVCVLLSSYSDPSYFLTRYLEFYRTHPWWWHFQHPSS